MTANRKTVPRTPAASSAGETGTVTSAFGGFYYLQPDSQTPTLECKVRGKLKIESDRLLVGDRVRFSLQSETQGVIEEILPRRSVLKRPAVANVDQVVMVFALRTPDFNPLLADRMLLLAEASRLDALVCLSKTDLVSAKSVRDAGAHFEKTGYRVLATSSPRHTGQRLLRALLKDRVSVVAGPSGAGKSALLNMVLPGVELVTGEVSERIGRGRHTTRHARLLPLKSGGFVADTPGFTQLDLDFLASTELAAYFPEMASFVEACRFRGCMHVSEPDCAVREAVRTGLINPERYEHYVKFLEEIRDFEKRRFR